jgi:hypothetical protein
LVGLVIFVGLFITALRSLWSASRTPDPVISNLAWTWLIALVVLLLGGITKTDLANKMLWLTIGIGMVKICTGEESPDELKGLKQFFLGSREQANQHLK